MQIAVGSDHAGYQLKERVREWLRERGDTVVDIGPHGYDPTDDYPDFARAVAQAVCRGEAELGIMICSTGIGSCIAANKVKGVRASVCHDTFSARMSRLHNDANVLCLGSHVVGFGLARDIVEAWLGGSFSQEERHRRRVAKLREMD